MTRPTVFLASILALAGGCGDSAPTSPTERGLKELRRGNYAEAIATCTQAVQQDPGNAEAYLYRGRAYQLRNAMGDPGRAIADLSEAIRLAPDSSDAYYYRSLVYRDLGQTQQATADDMKAREVDGLLQEVYRRLPDPRTPSMPAKTPEQVASETPQPTSPVAADSSLPKTESEQREMYEQLKERFEPFGTARQNQNAEGESSMKRYRQILRGGLSEPEPDEPPASDFGTLGAQAPRLSPPAAGGSAAGRAARPAPSSPFQPPPLPPAGLAADPGAPAAPPSGRQVESPFPQRAPGPTGYVPPLANPFAPQSFGPFSQQPQQSSGNLYSNPSVRPPNPREYIP